MLHSQGTLGWMVLRIVSGKRVALQMLSTESDVGLGWPPDHDGAV